MISYSVYREAMVHINALNALTSEKIAEAAEYVRKEPLSPQSQPEPSILPAGKGTWQPPGIVAAS